MKNILSVLFLFVCLPSFAQRFVEEIPTVALMKTRLVGSINKTVFVRGYTTPDDGGGGTFIITNSVIGVDAIFRIVSSQDATYSYERQFSGPADMRWGGAVANGTTDVTATIQATINAAATKGHALYVATPRGGKFRITGPIALPSNTTLIGDGLNSEFFLNNVDLAFQSSGNTNISISGIRFSGAYSRAVEGLVGKAITVKNCEFTGATRIPATGYISPVRMDSSSNVKILDNYFHHNGSTTTNFDNSCEILIGGGSDETHDVEISGNRIEGMLTRVSIATFSMAGGRILNNYVDQGNSIGVASNNGYGILVYGTPGITYRNIVSGNTVTNCAGSGIYLRYADGTVVQGNSVVDSGKQQSDVSLPVAGITVNLSYGAQVMGNSVTNATKSGINTTDSTNVVVSGNVIQSIPNRPAIEVRGILDNAIINGNIISIASQGIASTTGGGIFRQVGIINNSISNVVDGIAVETGTNTLIGFNQVYKFSNIAIANLAGSNSIIAMNVIANTTAGTSVGVKNDGRYATLNLNTISGTSSAYNNSDTNNAIVEGPTGPRGFNITGNTRLTGVSSGTQYALEITRPTFGANQYLLQMGSVGAPFNFTAFYVDASSNFVHEFNGVPYHLPTVQGVAGSVQVNDGAGTLLWQVGGLYNFGDQFQENNNTNIALADGLSTTNQNMAGNATFRSVHLGSVSGNLDVDASRAVAFTLLLSGNSTLNFTNWTDDHGVQLILTNAGSFSLLSTSVYPMLWTKTQNATPEANDLGAGVVNTYDFWKTGGRIIAYGKVGYGPTNTTPFSGVDGIVYSSDGTTLANNARFRIGTAVPDAQLQIFGSGTANELPLVLYEGVTATGAALGFSGNSIYFVTDGGDSSILISTNTYGGLGIGWGGETPLQRFSTNRNVLIGDGTTTTTRTNKFLYIPTSAGPPTGVPETIAGFVAIVFDTVNTNFYGYSAGAWNKIRLQ